jgi:hypothetical protein
VAVLNDDSIAVAMPADNYGAFVLPLYHGQVNMVSREIHFIEE